MSLRRPAPPLSCLDCTLETPFISQRGGSSKLSRRSRPLRFVARAWRERVIAFLGEDLQSWTVDPYLDGAVRTRRRRPSRVSEGVLVARLLGYAGIGLF